MIFKSKLLAALDFIDHGFCDKSLFVSRDFLEKYRNNEDITNHPHNINRILPYFPNEELQQFILQQVHSNKAVILNATSKPQELKNIQGDAIITNHHQQLICTYTADCAPIILVDTKEKIIAVIHAGWKGLNGGIIQNTIAEIEKLGGNTINIIATLGPCIYPQNYEVGLEFYETFVSNNNYNQNFFTTANKKDKLYFDLPSCVGYNLIRSGVLQKNFETLPMDTYTMEETFYSYRRYTKLKEDFTALQLSCIYLK